MKMLTQTTLALVVALVSFAANAHDDGHGPKVSDTGKYGGLVSAVVLKSDAEKGASAELQYKAELVRSSDGTTRVYLYDKTMKPLDLKQLDAKATGTVAAKVKGKWTKSTFELARTENLYLGKLPKLQAKPYDLDFEVKANGKELLSAFDGLD